MKIIYSGVLKIADNGMGIGAAGICCCLLIIIVFIFGGGVSENSSSTSDIVANDLVAEEESLPLINMTNVTLNDYKMSFVYYDHNSSKFNGCYGLNYTVLTDNEGNSYMLDHATTDILGEKTNYTFKYLNGVGLVFDNNTETEIYNQSHLYYVHEVRDDNNSVIKSRGNFTLHDKSHEPQIIPDGWLFVYTDHNSTTYEGDEGLTEAITHNKIGNHEELHFVLDEDIIGLAYVSDKTFDFRYGLSGINTEYLEFKEPPYYTAWGVGLCYPNGTKIDTFSIEDNYLIQKQKDFITNYDNRIGDVRHKQEIDAIYEAEDDAYNEYISYSESQNSKPKTGFYYGTNGYGVMRSY